MAEPSKTSLTQPLTFGGVAAFAQASVGRLWAFQVVIALLAAGAAVFFFETAWVPALTRTVELLPREGEIRNATLQWAQSAPIHAARSSFLQITVDPNDGNQAGESGDLQVEFGHQEIRLRSFFGTFGVPYPNGYIIGLNRPTVEPWWGAWQIPIAFTIGGTVFLGLLLIWTGLGFIYAIPARLIAHYADRSLSWSSAWRLASAALLPGALLLTAALAGYSVRQINLVQLIFLGVLHILVGWGYLMGAPFCLEAAAMTKRAPRSGNPFDPSKPPPANPFSDPFKPSP